MAQTHAGRNELPPVVVLQIREIFVFPNGLFEVFVQWLIQIDHFFLHKLHHQVAEHGFAERSAVNNGRGVQKGVFGFVFEAIRLRENSFIVVQPVFGQGMSGFVLKSRNSEPGASYGARIRLSNY